MIPIEVAQLATLIWDGWEEQDPEDQKEILAAAQRIYAAGWRRPQETASE